MSIAFQNSFEGGFDSIVNVRLPTKCFPFKRLKRRRACWGTKLGLESYAASVATSG